MSEFKAIETQEQLDAVIGERLKRERETVEKKYEGFLSPDDAAKKYAGYLSPDDVEKKYKGYLSPEESAEKDAKIKGYETSSAKMRIAHEVGLPYELAGRLTGEDEAAIRKDAENLFKIVGKKVTAPLASGEGTTTAGTDAALKQMVHNLSKKGE